MDALNQLKPSGVSMVDYLDYVLGYVSEDEEENERPKTPDVNLDEIQAWGEELPQKSMFSPTLPTNTSPTPAPAKEPRKKSIFSPVSSPSTSPLPTPAPAPAPTPAPAPSTSDFKPKKFEITKEPQQKNIPKRWLDVMIQQNREIENLNSQLEEKSKTIDNLKQMVEDQAANIKTLKNRLRRSHLPYSLKKPGKDKQ